MNFIISRKLYLQAELEQGRTEFYSSSKKLNVPCIKIIFLLYMTKKEIRSLRIKNSGYSLVKLILVFYYLSVTIYPITICKNIILYQNCYVPLVFFFCVSLHSSIYIFILIIPPSGS